MDSKQLGHVNTVPNQGETLARMCEEIRRRNLQATHFLVVFFRWGKDAAKGDKTKFRQLFFKFVTKREVVELAEDDFVHLQWKSPNSKTSSMYYTTSRFDEAYIRQLSSKVVENAYHQARKGASLSETEVALNSIVSKNLDFVINIASGASQTNLSVGFVPGDHPGEIEELDEEINLSPSSSSPSPSPSPPSSLSPSLSPSLSLSPCALPSLSTSFLEENEENSLNNDEANKVTSGRKRKGREDPPSPPKRKFSPVGSDVL